MRAKITHGGVTVELEDATAEDVERVLSAIGDKRPAFEPIKELAPGTIQPFIIPPGIPTYPSFPWTLQPDPTYPLITYCSSGNIAEVPS